VGVCPQDNWQTNLSSNRTTASLDPFKYPIPGGATTVKFHTSSFDLLGTAVGGAVAIAWFNSSDVQITTGAGLGIFNAVDGVPFATGVFTIPSDASYYRIYTSLFISGTLIGSFGANGVAEWLGTCADWCQYGVIPNPAAVGVVTITDSLITLVAAAALTAVGQEALLPFVEAALGVLTGLLFTIPVCDSLPEPTPDLDLTAILTWSPAAVYQWFQTASWLVFCKCAPATGGGPDPLPPPPPGVIAPPSVSPTQPPLVCDNTDICTNLDRIFAVLGAIQSQVTMVRNDVKVIQRQKVPFAYNKGTLHTGLTGNGILVVSDILGLSAQFTTVPSYLSSDMDPSARSSYFFGWLNLGTVDGWQRKIKLTHNPQLVLDVEGDVTRVEYEFITGVVANIQLLVAEP
jgi:hypothetical protein